MRNGPYILVTAPESYPGKRYRGRYVYEHHLVWWQKTGRLVQDGHVIHHKNEDKHDNRFKNLEEMHASAHSGQHGRERKQAPVALTCKFCRRDFLRDKRDHTSKISQGQHNFFCTRSCQVQQQHVDRKANTLVPL